MAIPKSAQKVYSGILYDVYEWEQEMFDGSKEMFEGLRRKPSVQVIAVYEDKIILLNEEQPAIGKFTAVPGGVFKEDETPEDAAARELLEETGCKAEELIFWKTHKFSVDIEWNTHYFIARNCKKIADAKPDVGEKIEPYFVTLDEFIEETQKESFRNRHLSSMTAMFCHFPEKKEEFSKLLFNKA